MTAPVVIKVGGHAVGTGGALEHVANVLAGDVGLLTDEGATVVIVHGAGPQIERALAAHGVTGAVIDGLRVTPPEAMDIVATALKDVNAHLTAALTRHGLTARSVLGREGLLHATARGGPWGRVGTHVTVDPTFLADASRGVPVVDPVATDADGHLLNCNADTVAGAIACALDAAVLVLLSDVDQIRADPNDPASALATVTRDDVAVLLGSGGIRGGMIPKVDAALAAVDAGARRVVIASAREPGDVRRAVAGDGTFTEVRA